MEDKYIRELVVFVRECTERRDPTPVLIHPINQTTLRKETMVPKYDTETWGILKVPRKPIEFLNPGSFNVDERHENFNLFPCPLLPYRLASWYLQRDRTW